jgi:hypothetical protein
LIVSFAVGRDNVGRIAAMVELALRLKAERVRIAYGADWIPTTEDKQRVAGEIERLRHTHKGRIVIDARMPAFDAEDMLGGGGEPLMFHVAPSGLVSASAPAFRFGAPFMETFDAG